ncbi:hypothetical protein HI914_07174 [Erysiphe necator]|nr:hypothetical protein HI914_07174 [Erysiphe necator]
MKRITFASNSYLSIQLGAMTISISSPADIDYRNIIHSSPKSPVTCYSPGSCQAESAQNDDLLDDILAFLDGQNPSSQLYSSASSPRDVSTPYSIKKWVEGLSTSPNSTLTFSLPPSPLQDPTMSSISTTSSVPQSPVSLFSRLNNENGVLTSPDLSTSSGSPHRDHNTECINTCNLEVMDLALPIRPEPIGPLPALPERSPNRILRRQQKVDLINLPLVDKKANSMPDLKERMIGNPKSENTAVVDIKSSEASTRKTHIQRRALGVVPSLSEFNFPFSPINENTVTSESPDIVSSNHWYSRAYPNSQPQTMGLSQAKTNLTSNLLPGQYHNVEIANDQNAKVSNETEDLEISTRIVTKLPPQFVSKSLSHIRSHSLTSANSKNFHSPKLQANYCINSSSAKSRMPLSISMTTGNLEDVQYLSPTLLGVRRIKNEDPDIYSLNLKAKKESVLSLMRKNAAPGIRLGIRLTAEKWDLLNTCRVIGMEVRLLTVRRRSLSGTRYEWHVVDNGMAVRGNTNCGRFVLKCLGELDGRVDFFTSEGIPIFRFQRTVGSTRTATSIDGDNENIYFSVRDGSWDCSVHWEVSLYKKKDQIAGKWLVSGDDQMQWLDIKQGDRTVGIIQDSGDHVYTLKVFPYNNWCIITALATFFDEWRAARVGLAL